MLRLLPSSLANKLTVFVSAQAIAIVSSAGKFNHHNSHKSSIICTPQSSQSAWQHALLQLDNLLGEFLTTYQIKPNTPLNIVLGSDLTRYVALPAQAISMNLAEKNAYASAAFKEIHGSNADDWQVVCNDAAPHQAIVAAAIDEKLLQHLNQLALTHQLKLKSVKPYLMVAINSLAKQLAKTTGYLAIVEQNRLTLIMLQQGQCQQLHSHAIGGDWQAEIKHILMRETVLADVAYRHVYIFAPTFQNTALLIIDGWHITAINQASKTNNIGRDDISNASRYAMLEAII